MNNLRKLFSQENFLFYIQLFLSLFSLIAIIFGLKDAFASQPNISSYGFQNFLLIFKPYHSLFAATIILITARIALKSFIISSKSIWFNNIKEFFDAVIKDNPFIIKDIIRNSDRIHAYLNSINYKISNKNELIDFTNKFFLKRIEIYEKMNPILREVSFYENDKMSYTWDSFKYIFEVMIDVENSYTNLARDLEEIYMMQVRRFSQGLINSEEYHRNMKQYKINLFFENKIDTNNMNF